MLPEILDFLEDTIDTLMPLFATVVFMMGAYFTAKVWRGKGASNSALEAINEKLDVLVEHSDAVRHELGEIQDRVEFTERLLANTTNRDPDSSRQREAP